MTQRWSDWGTRNKQTTQTVLIDNIVMSSRHAAFALSRLWSVSRRWLAEKRAGTNVVIRSSPSIMHAVIEQKTKLFRTDSTVRCLTAQFRFPIFEAEKVLDYSLILPNWAKSCCFLTEIKFVWLHHFIITEYTQHETIFKVCEWNRWSLHVRCLMLLTMRCIACIYWC